MYNAGPTKDIILSALGAVICICAIPCWGQEPPTLAPARFQNITALREMPADQMGKVMNIMSEALGTKCTHCHDGYNFAKEDTPRKAEARRMIEMTLKLNREYFHGATVVTCMTCHNGQATPPDARQSATAIARAIQGAAPGAGQSTDIGTSTQPASPESASDILERHIRAMGSTQQFATGRARKLKGQRHEPDGRHESEEVTITYPSSWKQVTHYGDLPVTEQFNAGQVKKQAGDKQIELKTDEEFQIKLEAHLALGQLPKLFDSWKVLAPGDIEGRPMQVLSAIDGQATHRFYFDQQTSLLKRRTTAIPTILGAYVIQVEYEDYERPGDVPTPLKTKFHMPGIHWQRQFEP